MKTRVFCAVLAVISMLGVWVCTSPVGAQSPTPTPHIVVGASGTFVVVPEVSYGQGGMMLAVLFVAGLLLLDIFLRIAERVTDR